MEETDTSSEEEEEDEVDGVAPELLTAAVAVKPDVKQSSRPLPGKYMYIFEQKVKIFHFDK